MTDSFDRNGFVRRIFPEVWFRVGLLEKWQIRKFERPALGSRQYISKTRFPANGKKEKKDNEFR